MKNHLKLLQGGRPKLHPGAILLLNRERVASDCIELACLRIARELKIDRQHVGARVDMGDKGAMTVNFEIEEGAVAGLPRETILGLVQKEHKRARTMMSLRLKGLGECWHEQEKEPATDSD